MVSGADSELRVQRESDFQDRQSALLDDDFVVALTSDGDSRLTVDRGTRVNKYLCPPSPAPELICSSSCTASPISEQGFRRGKIVYSDVMAGTSLLQRQQALEQCSHDIAARLLRYFDAAGMAEAILCPSGTDALLIASVLLAMERPDEPITAILPQASETGTGVPRAAAGCWFDRPATSDGPLPGALVKTLEIPLRAADGSPRSDDEVAAAYAAAAASVHGRPIIYLTHGTKTGLIAPVIPPTGADVIVDACQSRIDPTRVTHYLDNGWPVVVTGSKFFGGPAFSGAVLFPNARKSARDTSPAKALSWLDTRSANLGTVLRWSAAIDVIEAFAPLAAGMTVKLRSRALAIEQSLGSIATLVPINGLSASGSAWSDVPTIFTFAVRDPADRHRNLSMAALRPIYHRLASNGVLLGQPVELGKFGGLRLAVGARDLLEDAPADGNLPRLFAAVEDVLQHLKPNQL